MAPVSTSSVGFGPVGRATARPGRSSPGSDRSRSRAGATIPAVEPAATPPPASPRRRGGAGRGRRGPPPAPQPPLVHGDQLVGGRDPHVAALLVRAQQGAQ